MAAMVATLCARADRQTLESKALVVRVDTATGELSVRDKRSGRGWCGEPGGHAVPANRQGDSEGGSPPSFAASPRVTLDGAELVAVFTSADEYATSQGSHVPEFWRMCRMRLHLNVLPATGVPFDSYELSDIAHPKLPDYKVYVFPNAFTLSEEMRSKIKERVRRDGKTAVWIYAPGYYRNGAGCKENVEELTEFSLDRTTLGQAMPISWMLEPTGAATIERDGARGVFFPLPPDAAELREAFRAAGVHIWLETNDVMAAGRGYAMVHAASDGAKTLRLPCPCNAREVFDASPPHEGVSGITETLRRGETRVWHLEPAGCCR